MRKETVSCQPSKHHGDFNFPPRYDCGRIGRKFPPENDWVLKWRDKKRMTAPWHAHPSLPSHIIQQSGSAHGLINQALRIKKLCPSWPLHGRLILIQIKRNPRAIAGLNRPIFSLVIDNMMDIDYPANPSHKRHRTYLFNHFQLSVRSRK